MIRSVLGFSSRDERDHEFDQEHEERWKSADVYHSDDDSNWLVSYADIMTLLCGFFILLFVMSKMEDSQLEKMKQALAAQFGGHYQAPHEDLSKTIKEALEATPVKNDTEVSASGSGVTIVFRSKVFFDTLSAELSQSGRGTLEQLIDALREHEKSRNRTYRFVVEGHTDSRQILGGPFDTNWELSSARAARVVRVFIEKGFSPKKLAALGYADTRPSGDKNPPSGGVLKDEESLARDRRVVIRVFNDDESQVLNELGEESRAGRRVSSEK